MVMVLKLGERSTAVMVTRERIRQMTPPAEPIKIARVLFYLACGNSLNSIDAERLLDEHSLPSTISTLKYDHGFLIIRNDDNVNPGYRSYLLDSSNETLLKAHELLFGWGYTEDQLALFPDVHAND